MDGAAEVRDGVVHVPRPQRGPAGHREGACPHLVGAVARGLAGHLVRAVHVASCEVLLGELDQAVGEQRITREGAQGGVPHGDERLVGLAVHVGQRDVGGGAGGEVGVLVHDRADARMVEPEPAAHQVQVASGRAGHEGVDVDARRGEQHLGAVHDGDGGGEQHPAGVVVEAERACRLADSARGGERVRHQRRPEEMLFVEHPGCLVHTSRFVTHHSAELARDVGCHGAVTEGERKNDLQRQRGHRRASRIRSRCSQVWTSEVSPASIWAYDF
ncbi:hypothetical protein [Promicromonospora soli]